MDMTNPMAPGAPVDPMGMWARQQAAMKAKQQAQMSAALRGYSPPTTETNTPPSPGSAFQPIGPGPLPGYDLFQQLTQSPSTTPGAPPAPVAAAPAPVAPGFGQTKPGAAVVPSAALRKAKAASLPSTATPPIVPPGTTTSTPADTSMADYLAQNQAEKERNYNMQVEAMGIGTKQREAEGLRKEAAGWSAPNERMDWASQAARGIAGGMRGYKTGQAAKVEKETDARVQQVIDNWKKAKTPAAKQVAVDKLEQLGLSPEELIRITAGDNGSMP